MVLTTPIILSLQDLGNGKCEKSGNQSRHQNNYNSRKALVFYLFSLVYFVTLAINTTHST